MKPIKAIRFIERLEYWLAESAAIEFMRTASRQYTSIVSIGVMYSTLNVIEVN